MRLHTLEVGRDSVLTSARDAIIVAVMDALIAVLGSLVGVAVGGAATYMTQRSADMRREKHEARQTTARLYDNAIAAVARIEAVRWSSANWIDPKDFPAIDGARSEELLRELQIDAVRRLIDAKVAVQTALAALHPHSDDLRPFWDTSAPVDQRDFDRLMALLTERRNRLLEASNYS